MTVVAIERFRDGVLTSATQATLSIVNSAGSTILATTIIAPTSAGVYSYESSALPAGSYTATWVFTTAGLPTDTIQRAFTVDSASEVSEGITLMELERLVARRIGPYRRLQIGTGSSVNNLYASRLKSSLDIGAYEGQYLLRRGLTYGDELITNFTSGDRLRQAASFDAVTGFLTVDQAYAVAAISGEAVEIHAIDPDEELRPAILDGLKRCFFWDTLSISVTGSGVYNVNLTASAPWLIDPAWVKNVALSYPSQLLPPRRVPWWKTYRDGKDVKLYTKGGAVGSVSITVLRPAHTLVNREMSLAGPNDDFDMLYVDPDYAAWAGVLELWKTIPEMLVPLTAQGMRPSQADAAKEFTKKSLGIANQAVDTREIDYEVPDLVQIGNLAEPVT